MLSRKGRLVWHFKIQQVLVISTILKPAEIVLVRFSTIQNFSRTNNVSRNHWWSSISFFTPTYYSDLLSINIDPRSEHSWTSQHLVTYTVTIPNDKSNSQKPYTPLVQNLFRKASSSFWKIAENAPAQRTAHNKIVYSLILEEGFFILNSNISNINLSITGTSLKGWQKNGVSK